MKSVAILIACVGLFTTHSVSAQDELPLTSLVPASPEFGFHYPYLLRRPTTSEDDEQKWLIVETNNSGVATDDFDVHLKAARDATERGVGAFAANRLEFPLLVPAFPRPGGARRNVYTHALDSDSLAIASGPMKRLDLQLLAMIDDAAKRLRISGINVHHKVLMVGFSASATFANRFSMIHPDRIKAIAVGGFNGILMLPVKTLADTELPYPLGLSDFESRFGEPFDRVAWRTIPQFAFMGEDDTNDAVQFDDAYSDDDRLRVYSLMGKSTQPERWGLVQRIYKESGADFESVTYPHVAHATDGRIDTDIVDFLKGSVAP